ncbi:MAG: hypothetical protein IJ055_08515 [Oscillospiraceae bacterium]|nr:hypothetical protein [Oscillospiraceae bacterium]
MTRFIPYEKLGKKARRAIDRQKRGDWGGVRPLSRLERDARAYRRHEKHRGREAARDLTE